MQGAIIAEVVVIVLVYLAVPGIIAAIIVSSVKKRRRRRRELQQQQNNNNNNNSSYNSYSSNNSYQPSRPVTVIDKLLDRNCHDNVVIKNERGDDIEYKQVAFLPIDGRKYVILKPQVGYTVGAPDAPGVVFEIVGQNVNEIKDDIIIDRVFIAYEDLRIERGL